MTNAKWRITSSKKYVDLVMRIPEIRNPQQRTAISSFMIVQPTYSHRSSDHWIIRKGCGMRSDWPVFQTHIRRTFIARITVREIHRHEPKKWHHFLANSPLTKAGIGTMLCILWEHFDGLWRKLPPERDIGHSWWRESEICKIVMRNHKVMWKKLSRNWTKPINSI